MENHQPLLRQARRLFVEMATIELRYCDGESRLFYLLAHHHGVHEDVVCVGCEAIGQPQHTPDCQSEGRCTVEEVCVDVAIPAITNVIRRKSGLAEVHERLESGCETRMGTSEQVPKRPHVSTWYMCHEVEVRADELPDRGR